MGLQPSHKICCSAWQIGLGRCMNNLQSACSPFLKGPPAGGVTLNSAAGTSHRPGAPIFTLTMLEVMYWMPTLRGEMSGPNCGRVDSALLRLPVWAEPVCVSAL